MSTIIDFFTNNPTILVSIIVFFICVIIGFFGDQYLKKNKVNTTDVTPLNKDEDTSNLNETKETVDNVENNINDTNNMVDVNYNVDNNISLGIDNTIEVNQDVNSINATNNMVNTNYNANGVNYVDNIIDPSNNTNITSNAVDTDYMLNNGFIAESNKLAFNDMSSTTKQEKNPNIVQNNENLYINNDDNYTNMF